MLVPNDDASNAVDAMKASLGFDILTLSGNCPEAAAATTTEVTTTAAATERRRLLSTAGCSLVRTETHEAVFEGIDIIMLLAVNEAITAVSHLIGFAGWWMFKHVLYSHRRPKKIENIHTIYIVCILNICIRVLVYIHCMYNFLNRGIQTMYV